MHDAAGVLSVQNDSSAQPPLAVLFVHIPKTGGSTIALLLKATLDLHHAYNHMQIWDPCATVSKSNGSYTLET